MYLVFCGTYCIPTYFRTYSKFFLWLGVFRVWLLSFCLWTFMLILPLLYQFLLNILGDTDPRHLWMKNIIDAKKWGKWWHRLILFEPKLASMKYPSLWREEYMHRMRPWSTDSVGSLLLLLFLVMELFAYYKTWVVRVRMKSGRTWTKSTFVDETWDTALLVLW